MTMRTLVKGAGIAGPTIAWQLYRHNFDVIMQAGGALCRTEFATPSADGFVRYDNAALQ